MEMSDRTEDGSFKVSNPDAFGVEVIEELRNNDKIETQFRDSAKTRLTTCIANCDEISEIWNAFGRVLDDSNKRAEFPMIMRRFGFDETMIATNVVLALFNNAVLKIELFKLVLLFHLKAGDWDVGRFKSTMKALAPRSWHKLQPLIDFPERNAFAHAAYSVINRQVMLYEDASLNSFEAVELSDLIIRVKRKDVLFQCLINILKSKRLYALQ